MGLGLSGRVQTWVSCDVNCLSTISMLRSVGREGVMRMLVAT